MLTAGESLLFSLRYSFKITRLRAPVSWENVQIDLSVSKVSWSCESWEMGGCKEGVPGDAPVGAADGVTVVVSDSPVDGEGDCEILGF